jgi:signal transduction histidine kinase/FixJ family two-component response regulator
MANGKSQLYALNSILGLRYPDIRGLEYSRSPSYPRSPAMYEPSVRGLLVGGLSDTRLLKHQLSLVGARKLELTCVNGLDEVLEHLAGTPFDIVLLDLSLSGTRGIETMRAIRNRDPHIPILWLRSSAKEVSDPEDPRGDAPDFMIESRENPQAVWQAIQYAILRARNDKSLRESEQRYHKLAEELERIVENRTADLWTLNRTLEMTTGCSKAIVRATSEEELLKDICRIIVDLGGYQLAWIGFAQHDTARTILPLAQAGQGGICLQTIPCSWAEEDRDIPAGEAIRTCKPSVDCGLQRNPVEQSRCGYHSSIALPLKREGTSFGALIICSSRDSIFNEEQTQVLQELADDLAFGIVALRTRNELHTALQVLEQRSMQLRTLAAELNHAEERERKRLAEAIHDDLQQLLVAAKFAADTLFGGVKSATLKETAQQLNQFLSEAIESTRSLSFELSPPVLHNTGLAKALYYLGKRMEAKHGLIVKVQTDERAEPESQELRVILFQSSRELLFNVVKHAGVKRAEIDMRRVDGNFVQITVSDTGVGFDPEKYSSESSQNGFGLFSIRGRLDLIGGRLEIQSSPGAGSRCTMIAPLSKTAVAELASSEPKPESSPYAKSKGRPMSAGQRTSAKDSRKSK